MTNNAIKAVLWAAKTGKDSKPKSIASTEFIGDPMDPKKIGDFKSFSDWLEEKTAGLKWGEGITITCCSANTKRKT